MVQDIDQDIDSPPTRTHDVLVLPLVMVSLDHCPICRRSGFSREGYGIYNTVIDRDPRTPDVGVSHCHHQMCREKAKQLIDAHREEWGIVYLDERVPLNVPIYVTVDGELLKFRVDLRLRKYTPDYRPWVSKENQSIDLIPFDEDANEFTKTTHQTIDSILANPANVAWRESWVAY